MASAAANEGTALSGRLTGSAILGTSGAPPGVVGPDTARAVTEAADEGACADAACCVAS